jgi:hypothetical protein
MKSRRPCVVFLVETGVRLRLAIAALSLLSLSLPLMPQVAWVSDKG